jgi:hypothetical protein
MRGRCVCAARFRSTTPGSTGHRTPPGLQAAKYEKHLYLANADGSNIRLLGGSVYDERPDWQPVER